MKAPKMDIVAFRLERSPGEGERGRGGDGERGRWGERKRQFIL